MFSFRVQICLLLKYYISSDNEEKYNIENDPLIDKKNVYRTMSSHSSKFFQRYK